MNLSVISAIKVHHVLVGKDVDVHLRVGRLVCSFLLAFFVGFRVVLIGVGIISLSVLIVWVSDHILLPDFAADSTLSF